MDEVGEVEVEEDSEREEVEVEILVEGASSPTHYSDGEEQVRTESFSMSQ